MIKHLTELDIWCLSLTCKHLRDAIRIHRQVVFSWSGNTHGLFKQGLWHLKKTRYVYYEVKITRFNLREVLDRRIFMIEGHETYEREKLSTIYRRSKTCKAALRLHISNCVVTNHSMTYLCKLFPNLRHIRFERCLFYNWENPAKPIENVKPLRTILLPAPFYADDPSGQGKSVFNWYLDNFTNERTMLFFTPNKISKKRVVVRRFFKECRGSRRLIAYKTQPNVLEEEASKRNLTIRDKVFEKAMARYKLRAERDQRVRDRIADFRRELITRQEILRGVRLDVPDNSESETDDEVVLRLMEER